MLQKLAPYNKLIVALIGAVLTALVQLYGDNQALQIAVSVLTALGVYQVPNRKGEEKQHGSLPMRQRTNRTGA